ncbi:MAG: DUF3837 domain-containing protein [Roseburia sp.]
MVTSIARQSVVIKCNLHASIMVGNYEFYYAAGLLHKLTGRESEKVEEPEVMAERVANLLESFQPKDEQEQHLVRMLKDYEPVEKYDEQMQELFAMGEDEKRIWQQ